MAKETGYERHMLRAAMAYMGELAKKPENPYGEIGRVAEEILRYSMELNKKPEELQMPPSFTAGKGVGGSLENIADGLESLGVGGNEQ
jgi:hypothetical protein